MAAMPLTIVLVDEVHSVVQQPVHDLGPLCRGCIEVQGAVQVLQVLQRKHFNVGICCRSASSAQAGGAAAHPLEGWLPSRGLCIGDLCASLLGVIADLHHNMGTKLRDPRK
jgi:hypothetical protein